MPMYTNFMFSGVYAVRNSLRDDSPPASPQFLARTPLMARQYAPIAPVSFSRRTTTVPLTPPVLNDYDQYPQASLVPPPRTHANTEVTAPRRSTTKLDQLRRFHSFEPTHIKELLTRTTYSVPARTQPPFEFSMANDIEVDIESTTLRKIFDGGKRKEDGTRSDAEKDSESSYNMMFYNDDDNDIHSNKKDVQDFINENYYEKKGNEDDSLEKDFNDAKGLDIEYIDNRSFSLTKDLRINKDQIGPDNKGIIGIPNIEVVTSTGLKDALRNKRRSVCNLLRLRQLNFNSPRTLAEITSQLKQWAEESPMAKWVDITHGNFTTMENPIYMMIVDDPASGQIISAKKTVMIVAGIQGRDHHAVAAAMYVLYQLIERSEAHIELLKKYRFWIIPVFNPDGYDYSMTFPHRRAWTKNLRQLWDSCKGRSYCNSCETHGIRCTIQPCYGVNLDRNFEYQWIPANELRSEHPCGGLYAGPRQLSEIETRALTKYMHELHTPIFTFIAFKEGSVLGVMYPYSHTRKKRAYDKIYRQRASRAAAAAFSISNRPYVAGQTSEFLPLYAGGIEDWVDGHLGIDSTYTVMMFRPSDSYNTKLITERVVHEAFAAMDTLLLQSTEPTLPRPVTLVHRGHSSSSFTSPTRLMALISTVVLLIS
ncbi:unnamed protein product [Spodoptera exigua]|nr:unnamed protein product [Spodoptera exigua]